MRAGKYLVLTVAVLVLLGGAACKKKPKIPPQTQPPTITEPQPETPPAEPQPEVTTPTTTPPVTQPEPEPNPPVPKPKPHPKRKKTPAPTTTDNTAKPSAAKPSAPTKPGTETSAPKPNDNVQISAEMPQNVANQRRQQTEDLLNAAEVNLKKVNRSLTDGEQSMQRQVRNFITQSRLAIQDGDFERAYMLATKAQQLSQELVK